MMEILIFVILAYVIGSFPTGYIVVKLATGKDIRTIGSGSTGATNVQRVMGKKWFFFVLLFDAFKGALPVVLAKMFATEFTGIGLIPVLAAAAVIIGHSKSLFLKFSGGKSVASGVGTILALNPIVGGIIAVVWACVTYFSKYVSLGSIIALCLSPILMWVFNQPIAYVVYCLIGAVYITYLHRENIQRLIKGEENKVR